MKMADISNQMNETADSNFNSSHYNTLKQPLVVPEYNDIFANVFAEKKH